MEGEAANVTGNRALYQPSATKIKGQSVPLGERAVTSYDISMRCKTVQHLSSPRIELLIATEYMVAEIGADYSWSACIYTCILLST